MDDFDDQLDATRCQRCGLYNPDNQRFLNQGEFHPSLDEVYCCQACAQQLGLPWRALRRDDAGETEAMENEKINNMNGIELIAQERKEQTQKHGWTPEHDDTHINSELVLAALATLDFDEYIQEVIHEPWPEQIWPWTDEVWFLNIRRKDRIGQLVVAGALIAAEVDRLQRKANH